MTMKDILKYFLKFLLLTGFVLFYIFELVKANFRLAYDILSPRMRLKPAIIKVPVEEGPDDQILILFNLVSMTPGSLCIDMTPDRRYIYIHGIYVNDKEAFVRAIKKDFESRILKLFR
jgi:multicomponent Na+:H+ antiporter subunit E